MHRFDWTTYESASQAVVAAAADESGNHPCELAPLYGAVDPDALNALFRPGDAEPPRFVGGTVGFDYLEYRVELESGGRGRIYDRGDA